MQVTNSALSLFDFIDNKTQSDDVFDRLTKQPQQTVSEGLTLFERGLDDEQYESTLKQLDSGEINLDLETISRYLAFNVSRLDEQIDSLRENYDLKQNTVLDIDNNGVTQQADQEGQKNQRLDRYLEKNQQLTDLVAQTSKLSKFVEWAEAKQQAAEFKEQGMDEDKLVTYLKDARRVVTEPDSLLIGSKSFALSSTGHTRQVIDKYVEQPQTS